MSAGEFTRARYEADYATGAIHPIRVQPETLLAASPDTTGDPSVINASPTGAVTNPISALSKLSRREKGLRPRFVTLRLPLTGQPTGYKAGGLVRVIALTPAFYADCLPGQTMTYLGVQCEIVSREPERVS